jgi:pimeloyl-ACP methyl ester carboxylesterase
MQINGHELYIESYGPETGQPVLLLHDGLGSIRSWREQNYCLAEAGFRVVVYDRWGYGKSDVRPNLDVPGFATDQADLVALLEQLDARNPALVGHSDGGTIALYYAACHPAQVRCLVTIAAHIYVEPKMEASILALHGTFEQSQAFQEGLRRFHGEKYVSVFNNWFGGWYNPDYQNWDIRPLLGKIKCPALIVQGNADQHATPQHAVDIAAAIPGAELWLIPGAGHMLPQESSSVFNPRLVEFLQACA